DAPLSRPENHCLLRRRAGTASADGAIEAQYRHQATGDTALDLPRSMLVAAMGAELEDFLMQWAMWAGVLLAAMGAQLAPAPATREGYAQLPGVRLFYTDTGGRGAPIVLLHPATGSVRVWEHQTPALTKAGYRVIAFDRRGWGRTMMEAAGPQPGTAAD